MKILVYGAGVLGSILASRLYKAGIDVKILARGQRLQDIKNYGIILNNEYTGEQIIEKVPVVEEISPEDEYDFILVIMRKNQVSTILPILSRNRTPNIIFMGNNAKGSKEYAKALGKERVILGFPNAGGYRDGHVIQCIYSEKTPVTIGEIDGNLSLRLTGIL